MKNKELTLEQKIDFIDKSISEIKSNLEGLHYLCWKYSVLVFGKIVTIKEQLDNDKIMRYMKVGFPELYNGIVEHRIRNCEYSISFITNEDRIKFLNQLKVELNSK